MVINVDKQHALTILRANREAHIQEYDVQLLGWQKTMELHSKEMKKWVDAGGNQSKRPQEPTKPFEATSEYNDYIKKLTYHVDESIALEDYEFDKIINNNFTWQKGFLLNSNTYSVIAHE